MAVFIELTTDLFSQVFEENSSGLKRARRAGAASVRRPLRGLEIKDDTYAIMKVIDVAGNPFPMFDSSARRQDDPYYTSNEGTEYANFILQGVQEARMEKHQIVETFGEDYIFFFGEAPRFLDVQAVVLNSNDFNWEAEWWANYEAYWRGSRLTELGARLYLFYDDTIVEGYMLNAQAVKTAQEPLMAQMQFRLFVTNYTNVSFVDSDDFPIRGSIDASMVGNLSTVSGAQIMKAIADLDSLERGVAEQQAALAIQQAAFSKFGGGRLLADALRRGIRPGMGPQLTGGSGFGIGASAGIGVGGGAYAGAAAGGLMGANAQSFGGGNMGTPLYSTGSYSGLSPAGLPPGGSSPGFGYSYQGAVTPGGTFERTSTTSDGTTTVNTSVNGQPTSTVSGPAGQGTYAPSPFYPSAPAGMPYSGAPVGANPFAPNPFAANPYAPNAYGVNPYFPSPYAPTPFSATGIGQPIGTRTNLSPTNPFLPPWAQLPAFGNPTDSTVGPGYRGIVTSGSQQVPATTDPGLVRETPLRGKIWENTDEWTGGAPMDNADFPENTTHTDVEDLPYAAFLMLGAYGAQLSGKGSLDALGMGPRFGGGGIGIGAGASASAGASFGLGAGAAAGFGLSAGASAGATGGFSAGGGASFSAGAGAGVGVNGPYAAAYTSSSTSSSVSTGSPYPNYPGYGAGYGSGLPGVSAGYAPGPILGVGRSAGVGPGASFGGPGGGAVVMVGGVPTCFCLDSFPGSLRTNGGSFMMADGVVTTSAFTYGPDGSTFTQRTL